MSRKMRFMPRSKGFGQHTILAIYVAAAAVLTTVAPAFGQGCIVARTNGEQGGPDSEGGYLAPGQWEFGIGYRHQFSFIHFVGPTEQSYRVQEGTQVENKINLENFSATYQLTPRFSLSPIFRCSPPAAPLTTRRLFTPPPALETRRSWRTGGCGTPGKTVAVTFS